MHSTPLLFAWMIDSCTACDGIYQQHPATINKHAGTSNGGESVTNMTRRLQQFMCDIPYLAGPLRKCFSRPCIMEFIPCSSPCAWYFLSMLWQLIPLLENGDPCPTSLGSSPPYETDPYLLSCLSEWFCSWKRGAMRHRDKEVIHAVIMSAWMQQLHGSSSLLYQYLLSFHYCSSESTI